MVAIGAALLFGWVASKHGGTHDAPSPPVNEALHRPLDFTKQIYTQDHAIICPLSLVSDHRADHSPQVIFDAYTSIWNRSEKVKSLGCEEWRGGIAVSAYEARKDFVIVNGNLFTMFPESQLTNDAQ